MTHVRFLLNQNVLKLVDGEPGTGEVSRSQAEAWKAAGVPLEFIEPGAPTSGAPAAAPQGEAKGRSKRRDIRPEE